MSMDWFADVLAFEQACGAHYRTTPGPMPWRAALRISLIREEFEETIASIRTLHADMNHSDSGVTILRTAEVADGLADLIFVAIGTAISAGIDLRPVWDAVAAANLTKVSGPVRDDGKQLKPDGWVHPDIAAILGRQRPLPTGS